jgi:hypothetical protein
MDKFVDFGVDVFAILGMRNLSSFVGEVFAASLIKVTGNRFRKNPHQDGYPDLLLMDAVGRQRWEALDGRHREKIPFSPYASGGVEVKATCGSVPTPAALQKKQAGLQKPDIGDRRSALLTGYDWKAHHRDTNHLFGVFWDFIDRKPCIIAVFYSNSLTVDDWGKIVQPTEGGGRTTSVSVMTRGGVAKMYAGWVLCRNEPEYFGFFNRHNSGRLIGRAPTQPPLTSATGVTSR